MEEKNINFLDYMDELEDPRIERCKLHDVQEILFVSLVGVISGCDGWSDIEEFGKAHIEYPRKYLPFRNGVASDDTFRRFFRALDPEQFTKVFVKWTKAVVQSVNENQSNDDLKVIAIDGKTSRRSFDRDGESDKKALHQITAFATGLRIVLGQQKVDGKSNEITTIPELLDLLDLEGAIITIDAMGCQNQVSHRVLA
jgi:hypothetical protein